MDYKDAYENLLYERQREREIADRQRQREYERQQAERRERFLQIQSTANGWDEAFRKGIPRLEHEAHLEAFESDAAPEEYYFPKTVEEVKFAQQVYKEESEAVNARIQRIRERADRMITAIESEARAKAANRVDEHFGDKTGIADALRNDDFMWLVNW